MKRFRCRLATWVGPNWTAWSARLKVKYGVGSFWFGSSTGQDFENWNPHGIQVGFLLNQACRPESPWLPIKYMLYKYENSYNASTFYASIFYPIFNYFLSPKSQCTLQHGFFSLAHKVNAWKVYAALYNYIMYIMHIIYSILSNCNKIGVCAFLKILYYLRSKQSLKLWVPDWPN